MLTSKSIFCFVCRIWKLRLLSTKCSFFLQSLLFLIYLYLSLPYNLCFIFALFFFYAYKSIVYLLDFYPDFFLCERSVPWCERESTIATRKGKRTLGNRNNVLLKETPVFIQLWPSGILFLKNVFFTVVQVQLSPFSLHYSFSLLFSALLAIIWLINISLIILLAISLENICIF